MSFNITLYNFAKRTNSDKLPIAGTTNVVLSNCRLKSNTDILAPAVIVKWDQDFYPNYNYCYIPVLNRYYFIMDWEYTPPTWTAYCSIDALGTYRDRIKNSRQYIKRASNAAAINSNIPDTIYPTTTPNILRSQSTLTALTADFSGGSYVLGVIGKGTGSHTAVDYYVLNKATLKSLIDFMFKDTHYTGVVNVDTDLLKTMFDPFQYIVSLNWFPIAASDMPKNGTDTIKFGWWDSGITADVLSAAALYQVNGTIPIPKHTQIDDGNIQLHYLKLEPYSRYKLVCGAFGEIPIDATMIYDSLTLYISVKIDLITGVGKLYIGTTNNTNLAFDIERAQCSVPVQISQISGDIFGTMGAVLDTAATVARPMQAVSNWRDRWATSDSGFKQFIAGLTTPFIAEAGDYATKQIDSHMSQMPQLRTMGSNGSTIEWGNIPYMLLEMYEIPERHVELTGAPASGYHFINDIPGYIEVLAPRIEWDISATEIQLLSGLMQSGFYHEE